MELLARREHSCQELTAKLVRKGWSESIAQEVVQALANEHMVSDERFAESLLQTRRQRGYGPVRIQHELSQKGVADSIIESIMEPTLDQGLDPISPNWMNEIRNVKEKKFGKEEPKDIKERARQARFLQHRGFTFDQIRQVLNNNSNEY